jgi:hypothetical protein
MRSKPLSLLTTAALLAGAVFLFFSWHRHQNVLAGAWAEAVALDQRLQDEAFQAYRSGPRAAALPALQAYLQHLEQSDPLVAPWGPGENPWLDVRGLATERMITAGRLAMLMEHMAAADQASALWRRAVEYARASGRTSVSLATVREAVVRSGAIGGPPDADGH